MYKKEQLLADFDQVVETFMVRHPKTFTDLSEFTAICLLQRGKITDMFEYDFFQVLAPVIGSMRCGHAYINYSEQQNLERSKKGNFLPFNVKVIDKALYIVDDLFAIGIKKGAKIHTINDHNVADLIEKIMNSSTGDRGNYSAIQAKLNANCNNYCPNSGSFNLAYYNFIGSPESFHITYSTSSDQALIKCTTAAKAYNPLPERNEPLSFSYQSNLLNSYATLTIPDFYTYQLSQFEIFTNTLDCFFIKLKMKGIDNLILDLRGNGGGDPNAGNLLLTYLLRSPFQYFNNNVTGSYLPLTLGSQINTNAFSGKLVTLIDGLCFSTTGHMLSHLVDQKRTTLIGQESGGSYICNDRSKMIRLNNTKIAFNLPNSAFSTAVQGKIKGQGIMPDIETKYSIEDYLNNIDLEMQTALAMIQQ